MHVSILFLPPKAFRSGISKQWLDPRRAHGTTGGQWPCRLQVRACVCGACSSARVHANARVCRHCGVEYKSLEIAAHENSCPSRHVPSFLLALFGHPRAACPRAPVMKVTLGEFDRPVGVKVLRWCHLPPVQIVRRASSAAPAPQMHEVRRGGMHARSANLCAAHARACCPSRLIVIMHAGARMCACVRLHAGAQA